MLARSLFERVNALEAENSGLKEQVRAPASRL